MPNTEPEGALAVAEKVRHRVQEQDIRHETSPVAKQITVSLGVAWVIPDASADPEELVAAADKALYKAKAAGRNRVVQYESRSD